MWTNKYMREIHNKIIEIIFSQDYTMNPPPPPLEFHIVLDLKQVWEHYYYIFNYRRELTDAIF